MTASRQRFTAKSTHSVLDDIISGSAAHAPTTTTDDPPTVDVLPADRAPTQRQQDTDEPRTDVQQSSEDARTAVTAGGSNAPGAGKKRQTFYVSEQVVAELHAAADTMRADLRGVFPKNVILDALIRAGIAQSDAVRAQLLAGLLADLQKAPASDT